MLLNLGIQGVQSLELVHHCIYSSKFKVKG